MEGMMNRSRLYAMQFTSSGLKTFHSSPVFMYHPVMNRSELTSIKDMMFSDLKKMGWRPIPEGDSLGISFFLRELPHQDRNTICECCVNFVKFCSDEMLQCSAYLLTPSEIKKIHSSKRVSFSERKAIKSLQNKELVRGGWIEAPPDKSYIISDYYTFFVRPNNNEA